MTTSQRQGTLDWSLQPPYLHADYKSTVKRAPQQPLIPLAHSLAELTGPVYGHEHIRPLDNDLTCDLRRFRCFCRDLRRDMKMPSRIAITNIPIMRGKTITRNPLL